MVLLMQLLRRSAPAVLQLRSLILPTLLLRLGLSIGAVAGRANGGPALARCPAQHRQLLCRRRVTMPPRSLRRGLALWRLMRMMQLPPLQPPHAEAVCTAVVAAGTAVAAAAAVGVPCP